MTAVPETLKAIRFVHDTVRVLVGDTVVVSNVQAAPVNVGLPSRFWLGLWSPEWLTALGTIALVLVGWRALWTWRHEFRVKAEYRLALRVYVAVLRLRDRIESARGGFHMLWLSKEESEDRKKVLQLRYEQYVKLFREVVRADLALLTLRPEVEIHWGTEGTLHLDALDERARKLRGGFQAYFHHSFEALDDPKMSQYAASDARTAFVPLDDEGDEYGVELSKRVEEATVFLRPKLTLTPAMKRGSRP